MTISERVDRLVGSFDLVTADGKHLDARQELTHCIGAHKDIWEQVDGRIYTDHGFDHSVNIFRYYRHFVEPFRLSPYDQLVGAVSALIHDIGMQFNRWGELRAVSGRTIAAELGFGVSPGQNLDAVRERHVEFGYDLIGAAATPASLWSKPAPFCSNSSEGRTLLERARVTAFAHSSFTKSRANEDLWTLMSSPDFELGDDRRIPTHGDQWFHPRAVAGAFRLADELDACYDRVPDLNDLWSAGLKNDSRVHWLACALTHDVILDVSPTRRVTVRIRWRVPRGASTELRGLVRRFVLARRLEKISHEFDVVNTMFMSAKQPELVVHPLVTLDDDPTDTFSVDNHDDIRELIQQDLGVTPKTGRIGSGGHGSTISVTAKPPLDDMLKTWLLDDKVRPGHWLLVRGGHTNALIRVRSLVSQERLIREVVAQLLERLALEKDRVALVIGVGTACVPMAVALALALGTMVTFATHQMPSAPKTNRLELELERKPITDVGPTGLVIVLDDLVAQGRTGAALLGELETLNVDMKRCRYFSLLRIKDVPLFDMHGVTVEALSELGGVTYSPPGEACAMCDQGMPLFKEVEATY